MDIMMPIMDGFTAMQEIRKSGARFRKVPIIALTAKAMKEDRTRCIEAGANDYIAKPVDVDRLLSMMRVWLENPPAHERRSGQRPWREAAGSRPS